MGARAGWASCHRLIGALQSMRAVGSGDVPDVSPTTLPFGALQLMDRQGGVKGTALDGDVNRTLKILEAEHLIERRSSRTVTIGDWKKLARAGDFDSAYLHLHGNEAALS